MIHVARRVEASLVWLVLAIGCGEAKPIAPQTPGQPSPPSEPVSAGESSSARHSDPMASQARVGASSNANAIDDPLVSSSRESTRGAAGDELATSVRKIGEATACPDDMKLVDTTYCPNIQRTCVEEEYSPQNHITICHKFATNQKCIGREEHRRFCIDEYEYPNQKGAHPTWMVSWYDAQATCASRGKRLCNESEWVTACEGPEKLPFPYGRSRDNKKCNIDNSWIQPSLVDMYSKDATTQLLELSRLDQSAPSGAMEGCVSGFGVRDLTGNFDEWVTADVRADDKSEWAALKGGAWGHVRNACRPTTTSHPPDFTYYFIAFRCCREAYGGDPSPPSYAGAPDVEPENRARIPEPAYPPGPSSTKVGREHWPKPGATPAPPKP